jgi:hypothetical protein
MSGTRSRAATRWISDVPGFAKHVSIPQDTREPTTLSAPFICLDKVSFPPRRISSRRQRHEQGQRRYQVYSFLHLLVVFNSDSQETELLGPAYSGRIAEKRQIVEDTMIEGASVARIARAHGVNAKMQINSLLANAVSKRRAGTATLQPVGVTPEKLSLRGSVASGAW